MSELISRRSLVGGLLSCLATPLIPVTPIPNGVSDVKQSFHVEHRNYWGHEMVNLGRGGHSKWYRKNSVAWTILALLFNDEDRVDQEERPDAYGLLEFLWERHDHEATDII